MEKTRIENCIYTPSGLGDIKFRIPLYQRPFSWGKSQVKQLLEDLYASFDSHDQNYYIGIMSICPTDSDPNRYDLIDGQQRITTLMLIGKALKNEFDYWGKFMDGRLDLYGRKEDSDYLNSFGTNPNPRMLAAVEVVRDFMARIQIEKGTTEMKEFAKYIYEHTAFFLSEIPADYSLIDKNNFFVRMNHRGKQLEQADILKIKLGKKLEENQQQFFTDWNKWEQLGCIEEKENNPKKGAASIREIIENKETVEDKNTPKRSINDESIISFPEFLLIALEVFVSREKLDSTVVIKYQKDKLLSNFDFYESDSDGRKKEFWNEDYVTAFQDFVNKLYDVFLKYFIRKDKTEKYTWFLIKDENDSMCEERNSSDWKKIKMFQSYLYVSTEPHLWMREAFAWALNYEEEQKDFAKNFLNKLKEIDNANHQSLPQKYEFKMVGNYWFRRLDYYLWEMIFDDTHSDIQNVEIKDNECLAIQIDKQVLCGKFIFRNNSPSVEHLHPQDESQCNDKWSNSDAINHFGNLALISQGLNSYQSNKPVEEKLGKIENILNSSNGVLDSVKLYLMYLSAKSNQGKWTPELAKAHGEQMIEFLKGTFPDESKKAE